LALKIPILLAEFLYKTRKLALPGIGIFTLDKSVVVPQENDQDLIHLPNGVQFQNANVQAADNELISYITQHTGKIKPLATSDLESYLTLGMEMLNIGKPFYLDGLGTITKDKAGKLDFSPGEFTVIKEDPPAGSPDHGKHTGAKEYARSRKAEADPSAPATESPQNRNLIRGVAIVAALLIVGWGGYLMYKNTAAPETNNNTEANAVVPADTSTAGGAGVAVKNDMQKAAGPDTTHHVAGNKDSVLYKFIILPTYNKAHALRRYRQLLSFDLKAHLDEKDSTFFKVYFQFPAMAKDTIRIKDSLKRQYAHEITIEE
jgi:hypothetical protein